jgi:hypothetical protein
MFDGGPLNGGLSAKLVIHDKSDLFTQIVNRLEPVVGITTFSSDGKLNFQLINREHELFFDLLKKADSVYRLSLPLYVLSVTHYSPSDATPEPVR